MKPTRFPLAALAVLAFSVFAGSAFAASAEDTAKLYLGASEAASMKLTDFESGGAKYYAVSSGGVELLVLKESAGSYAPVATQSELAAILPAYITKAYGSAFSTDQVTKARADFDKLRADSEKCTYNMGNFLTNSFLLYYIKQIDDRGSPVPTTANAIRNLSGFNGSTQFPPQGLSNLAAILARSNTYKISNGTHAAVVGGISEIGNLTYSLSSAQSASEVKLAADSAKQLLGELKPIVDRYQSDYDKLYTVKQHFAMFNNKPCGFKSTNFSTLESDLNVGSSIPSASGLADKLANSTGTRADGFYIRTLASQAKATMDALNARFSALSEKVKSAGLDMAGLSSGLKKASDAAAKTDLASSRTEADNFKKAFDAQASGVGKGLDAYENATLLGALNQSNAVQASARLAIDTASTRLGSESEEITGLKDQYNTVRLELDGVKADLSNGVSENAVPKLQNITASLSGIEAKANGLKPPSEQFDLLFIGGLVLVIVILVGVFYFYKNRKPPTVVVSAPPSSSVIISRPSR